MNDIYKVLDGMEARAIAARGDYGIYADCWRSAGDALALVKACRRALVTLDASMESSRMASRLPAATAKRDITAILSTSQK